MEGRSEGKWEIVACSPSSVFPCHFLDIIKLLTSAAVLVTSAFVSLPTFCCAHFLPIPLAYSILMLSVMRPCSIQDQCMHDPSHASFPIVAPFSVGRAPPTSGSTLPCSTPTTLTGILGAQVNVLKCKVFRVKQSFRLPISLAPSFHA